MTEQQCDPPELEARVRTYAALSVPALHPAAGVVLAVSGGGDSIATAALLCEAALIDRVRSVVAHFDHRLRGEAAAAKDRAAVRALCQRYGLRCVEGAWGAPAHGEAAARQARYAFLAGVAAGAGLRAIVTGHTSDDQIETVIMHRCGGAACTASPAWRRTRRCRSAQPAPP